MATISTHLRNFKEPTKDQLTQLFFSLPVDPQIESNNAEKGNGSANGTDMERMEISATLSLGISGVEEPYVSYKLLVGKKDGKLNVRASRESCTLSRHTLLSLLWIGSPCGSQYHYARSAGLNA